MFISINICNSHSFTFHCEDIIAINHVNKTDFVYETHIMSTISPPCRAVLMAGAELGIDFEWKNIDLLDFEHKKLDYIKVKFKQKKIVLIHTINFRIFFPPSTICRLIHSTLFHCLTIMAY